MLKSSSMNNRVQVFKSTTQVSFLVFCILLFLLWFIQMLLLLARCNVVQMIQLVDIVESLRGTLYLYHQCMLQPTLKSPLFYIEIACSNSIP